MQNSDPQSMLGRLATSDWQWLVDEIDTAIVHFDAMGTLVWGNLAFQALWPRVTKLITQSPQALSLNALLSALVEQGYFSTTQHNYLANSINLAQETPQLLGLTQLDGLPITLKVRRSPSGDLWWLVSPATAAAQAKPTSLGATPTPLPNILAPYDYPGFLQSILAAIPEPLLVKDENYRWVMLNQAMLDLTGYPQDVFLGRTDYDLFPPEQAQICQAHDERVLTGQSSLQSQEVLTDAQGQNHAIAISKQSFSDDRGRKFIVGIIQDVTNRQQIEKALKTSEGQLRALVKAIPDLLMRQRDDGSYNLVKLANVAEPYVSDLPQDGRSIFEVLSHPLAERRMQATYAALQSGKPQIYEQQIEINSQTRYEQVRVAPCGEHEVVVLVQDISERKRTEVALRTSESTTRALLQSIPDLLLRMNGIGQFWCVKDSTEAILYGGSECREGNIMGLFPDALAMLRIQAIRRTLKTGEMQIYEQVLEGENQVRYEEVRITPYQGDEVLVMVRDIGDRKRAEQEVLKTLDYAHELNRLKSRFITLVSHEIRTPLAQIQMATELLECDEEQDPDQVQYLTQIQHGIQRIVEMMEESSRFRQLATDMSTPDISVVNIQALCLRIIQETRQKSNRTIQFSVDQPNYCQEAELDADMVRSSLESVLSNALKYSESDRPIHITLTGHPEHLTLCILDEGIGILPEDRPYLFDFFHRGSNVENRAGAGLGLATTNHYVGLLGGTIEINSAIAQGTIVTITLPRFFFGSSIHPRTP